MGARTSNGGGAAHSAFVLWQSARLVRAFFLNGSWRGFRPRPVGGRSVLRSGASTCIRRLTKNHGFIDGGERMAQVAGRPSPADKSHRPDSDTFDAIHVMKGDADALIRETELAAWLRSRLRVRMMGVVRSLD